MRALSSVTLHVERGEVFGLLGPNGAGKTTLLKVLATLILPSAGSARVCGMDLLREPAAVRRVVGLAASDERAFYWRLNGRENLEFFAALSGLPPQAARRRVDAVLEIVDLLSYADEAVARYSTGMRQRLGIARALVNDPTVLLLDEPTRSLDPAAADHTRGVIQRLAREGGRTVLLTTHQLNEAATVCDRVAVLVAGTIRAVVAPQSLGEAGLAARYQALQESSGEAPLPTVGLR